MITEIEDYNNTITITVDFREGLNESIMLIIIAITISLNGEFKLSVWLLAKMTTKTLNFA